MDDVKSELRRLLNEAKWAGWLQLFRFREIYWTYEVGWYYVGFWLWIWYFLCFSTQPLRFICWEACTCFSHGDNAWQKRPMRLLWTLLFFWFQSNHKLACSREFLSLFWTLQLWVFFVQFCRPVFLCQTDWITLFIWESQFLSWFLFSSLFSHIQLKNSATSLWCEVSSCLKTLHALHDHVMAACLRPTLTPIRLFQALK